MEEYKKVVKDIVQALLALLLTAAVVYMSIVGTMPPEILASLAGGAVAFVFAERKNGEERQHRERIEQIYSDAIQQRLR